MIKGQSSNKVKQFYIFTLLVSFKVDRAKMTEVIEVIDKSTTTEDNFYHIF